LAAGEYLARGYLNAPALTSARFVVGSFDGGPTTTWFKTGDLARQLSDETIELIG
jgi:non-ribosomal peptide synthetase component F